MEVYIALFVRDAWVRPYGGDLLAVVWVYCLLRSALTLRSTTLALAAFAVGAGVEVAQYLEVPRLLGLSRHPVLSVIAGTTFQWGDLLAYALGAALAYGLDEGTSLLRCRTGAGSSA